MSDPWTAARRQAPPTPPSYEETINDPRADPAAKEEARIEAALGQTAVILLQRGQPGAAQLLLDVERAVIEYDPSNREDDLWLEVAPEQMSQINDDVVNTMRQVLQEVSARRGYGIDWLAVREVLPDVGRGWREQLRSQLEGNRPTNQGRRVRTASPRWTEDGVAFTNSGELQVYRALKQIQEQDLPPHDTLSIWPLPAGRLPGRTWEPDMLVIFKGRAGLLEIDGPDHNRRRALDLSRDHLFQDAGVALIDRVPVEALNNPTELIGALRRFLRRLTDPR